MRSIQEVRSEHAKARAKMNELMEKGRGAGVDGPLPGPDHDIYMELDVVRMTLEWLDPDLIETSGEPATRPAQLASHTHYALGPVFAVLHP